MKTLLVNGSPRQQGNTATALAEIAKTLQAEGVETETFWIGAKPVRGCIACGRCREAGRCVFDDDAANALAAKMAEADAVVVGSPVYYGQPNGALLALLQRALFSASSAVAGKPVATVAICRRGGATAAFQCLNLPFQMLSCTVVGSQYWNIAYGREAGEAAKDTEGMQTMRTLARNLAWLLKSAAATTWAGAIAALLTALLAGCAHLDAAKCDDEFVPLAEAVPDAILEIRYYSTYNFVGDRVDGYERPVAYLTKEAAAALRAASDDCVARGYRLTVRSARSRTSCGGRRTSETSG